MPVEGLFVSVEGLFVPVEGSADAGTGTGAGAGTGDATSAALTNFALSLAKSGDPSPVVGSHPTVA